MSDPLILTLDQGTTSSRAMVFDASGAVVATSQQEFRQHFPQLRADTLFKAGSRSVSRITDKRMTDVRHVHTNLVASSGLEPALD